MVCQRTDAGPALHYRRAMLKQIIGQDLWQQAANDPCTAWSPPGTADRQFVDMLEQFRPTGGLAPIAEVCRALMDEEGLAHERLEHWIENRAVICFEWQSRRWIPWFQFSRKTKQPHRQLRELLAELNAVHQPFGVAHWFAQAHPWLGGRTPVHSLVADLPGVLQAARADRLIANGPSRLRG
jgi:hypothetical protein